MSRSFEEEEVGKEGSPLSDPWFIVRHWIPAFLAMVAEPNLGESLLHKITLTRTFKAPEGVSKEEEAFYREFNEITVGSGGGRGRGTGRECGVLRSFFITNMKTSLHSNP